MLQLLIESHSCLIGSWFQALGVSSTEYVEQELDSGVYDVMVYSVAAVLRLLFSHMHIHIIQFMRYLHMYDVDAGIKIVPCTRYSNESCGAKIIVTKHW